MSAFDTLMAGLAVGAVIMIILCIPFMGRRGRTYGTAHWAELGEAQQYAALEYTPESQLVLGWYRKMLIALSEVQQQSHVLVVGPTGQRKTANVIIPALLCEKGNRSLFVIDPKNELVPKTAGDISRRHRCWFFAPTNPQQSHCYNPLAHISTMEDAQDFARCWIVNTGVSGDSFWDRNAELLITAAVLHLRATEPDAPFSRLADVLTGNSFQALSALFAASPSSVAQSLASTFLSNLNMDVRLAGGILTGIASRFFTLHNASLKEITKTNDLDFDSMIDYPTALYLSIPASAAERLRPLSACLMMQMFATWIARAERSPSGMLPRSIACYLDEFANAGYIPHMAQRISMLRSTRVALILVIQNFAQLDAVYGNADAQTILANATTHIVLPGVGQMEAEYYSARCGDQTVRSWSYGYAPGGRGFLSSTGTSREVGRPLIMPDEIRTMPQGRMLMVAANAQPMLIDGIPYFAVPALMQRVNLPYQLPMRANVQTPAPPTSHLPPPVPPTP